MYWRSKPLSFFAVCIGILFLSFSVAKQARWNDYRVLAHDMYVYYNYLPATFIYADLNLGFIGQVPPHQKAEIWCMPNDNGNCVPKMTMGMSFMYAPFFAGAHILAHVLGFNTSGYSSIYHLALALAALFYAALSLVLLRSFLLKFYSDIATASSLFALFLGSNLYFYIVDEGAMTHAYLFFLSILMLHSVHNWHQKPSIKSALSIGALLGLMALIRPTQIVFVLLWLLYDIRSIRLQFFTFIHNYKHTIVALFSFLSIWIPQLLFWKMQSGSWLYYSYSDEGFFWGNPKVIDFLFSYRKGWLLYSPIMALSILGVYFLWKAKNPVIWPLMAIFPMFLYIAASWWCWWYGGSFGQRTMIDLYALLALPLTAFTDKIRNTKILAFVFHFVLAFLIYLNFFQTEQYRKTIIHYDSMTREAYWNVFLHQHFPENQDALYKHPDYDAAKKGLR
jgi:hypothetical protein